MIRIQDTFQTLVPILLTFLLVLAYQSIISTMVSGILAFAVTIVLSIATWYVICRVAFDNDGRLAVGKRPF